MNEQALPQAMVFGKSMRLALPEALIRQLGVEEGDLLLTTPQAGGSILVRRIDGKALIHWLRSFNVKASVPAEHMLVQLRRIGFDATMLDGRVSYEGGVLDEWTNTNPAVRDGELVLETTRGLHNASDVLHFLLIAVLGNTPSTVFVGTGFQYNGWVNDLAKRLSVAE